MMGFCSDCNENSGTMKGGEFIDKLSDCQILKKTLLHTVNLSALCFPIMKTEV